MMYEILLKMIYIYIYILMVVKSFKLILLIKDNNDRYSVTKNFLQKNSQHYSFSSKSGNFDHLNNHVNQRVNI